MSRSRDQLNQFLSEINIEGKVVLDVGVQDKPSSRICKGQPAKYLTLDVDPQWNPDVVADLNEDLVTEELKDAKKNTDIIFCIEVLEHCWNPVQVVQTLFHLLKPGGILYISTPFINPHHDVTDYLRFTNEWYRDVLPRVGFSEVEIHERIATVGKSALQAFYQLEGLRVSKIRPEYGRYTYPIGYFIKAKKAKNDERDLVGWGNQLQ